MADTTGEALNKATDAAIAGVEQLAAAVEKIAPDAWEVMVRQQVIEAWVTIGAFGVLWLFVAFGWVLLWRLFWCAKVSETVKDDDKTGAAIAALVISAILLLPTVVVNCTSVAKLLNPEYYAAQAVAELVK